MNKKEKEERDRKQHIADAKKTLEFLKTAQNNLDWPDVNWEQAKKTRISMCEEAIVFWEKGDSKHISIDAKVPTPKDEDDKELRHFN